MVEELRAVAPRPRSATWLARRFEVSSRTVERDISALEQAGVPVYAEPGRTGGYTLDKSRTLPPVNINPEEAVAIAVALETLHGTPFHDAARSALRKLVAVMPASGAAEAHELAGRIKLIGPADPQTPTAEVPAVIAQALSARQVLRFGYVDRRGEPTTREIEPIAYLGGGGPHWYLLGWCRMREALRAFRLDRIADPVATDEVAPPRRLDPADLSTIPARLREPTLH
jgi:predicted DNA-binding transcriptional regulator YafY